MFWLGECMWWFLNKIFQKMPKNAVSWQGLSQIVVYNNSAGWRSLPWRTISKRTALKITMFSFEITRQIGEKIANVNK